MGEKCFPMALAGTGTGKFSPHGDGDGGSIPDGEFPIAILTTNATALDTQICSLSTRGALLYTLSISKM